MIQAAAVGGGECPMSAVFDGRVEKSLCTQRMHAVRQRLLHSTDSNQLTVHFKAARDVPSSRQTNVYLLHYEGSSTRSLFWPVFFSLRVFDPCKSHSLKILSGFCFHKNVLIFIHF